MRYPFVPRVSLLTRLTLAVLTVTSLTACQYLVHLRLFESEGAEEQILPPEPEPAPPPVRVNVFPLQEDLDIVGQIQKVTAHHEDTLFDIARRYDLGIKEIAEANPDVDKWLPGEGTEVILPTQFILPDAPRQGIVLNLAAMRLFYYPKPKQGEAPVVITHPIGIGRENWSTPMGLTKVVKKVANPSWIVPASIRKEHAELGDPLPAVVPPGPDNPLGTHALRLGRRAYLIHGTNKPAGIGMRVSHGCIQLYPEDIETLFNQVPVGTHVRIINRPYLAGWKDGVLYLEAHRPLEEQARAWGDSLKPMIQTVKKAESKKPTEASGPVDWERATQVAKLAQGIPLPITSDKDRLNDGLPPPVAGDKPQTGARAVSSGEGRLCPPYLPC